MKPLPFSPQLACELHEEPARSISKGVKSFISVVHNTAAQLKTGPHPGAAGSNPRSQLSFLSCSPAHTHTPPAPNTLIPFFTLQYNMSIMVRGKLGSLASQNMSFSICLICLSLQGLTAGLCISQAAAHQAANVFSTQVESNGSVGRCSPWVPPNSSHQGTPPSSSALTASKPWQKTPPLPGIRPFAQYQPMTQPWAENPEMEALCFPSKI